MKDVLLGLLIPFLGTSAGACCVFFMKKELSRPVQRALNGFAAGVMVAASVWSLLIPAMQQSAVLERLAFLPAFCGFWCGIGFLLLLDHVIPHLHRRAGKAEGPKSRLARTTMMVLAVTLHNIPEGMAVGVVYAGLLNGSAQITADRVLSSILDHDCAERMQTHLERHGVRFLLEDTAVRYENNTALMKSGKTVAFDLLVLAVGVRANTALVKACGGKTERGILVDDHMQTSLPDIYAAGDCTQGMDASIGQQRVLAILPNASLQGRCAGINMAGGAAVFSNAIPMNAIGFFGLHALSTGSDCGGDVYEETDERHLKRLYSKDNRLTGFMLIGETAHAGIYTSLIREKTPLDSLDFERLKQTPTTTAFSLNARRQKFGGAV